MINWRSDKKVVIFFSCVPEVRPRTITPYTEQSDAEHIKKYPFMNMKKLNVWVNDLSKRKQYAFSIAEGYCFDGATIPRMFWRLIGPNSDPQFLIPAMIHDFICQNKKVIGNDRSLSSEIFYALLLSSGVGRVKASVMKNTVDLYQRTQRWGA